MLLLRVKQEQNLSKIHDKEAQLPHQLCQDTYDSLNKDDEFVCGRKYCFSCLKDSYSHENIKENGLCPFCLGVCICTRCLRNEKIAKFKNMYSMLGGDVAKMQDGSDLEQLQVKSE